MSKIKGYICLWRLPNVNVDHDVITQLADDAGFDQQYIPKPKNKRRAWEKATNLGSKGMVITPPQDKINDIKRRYGTDVEPVVKLQSVVIKRAAPVLVRHIRRRVTVPVTKDLGNKRQLAEAQLDEQTVAILEFDCETDTMRSTGYELSDTEGFVNGNLQTIVQDLMDDVHAKVNGVDADMIRERIRAWFDKMFGTLQSSGGAYFVPNRPGVFDDLKAGKVLLESLHPYTVKGDERPSFMIIPLTEDGEAFEAGLDVAHNAVEQFKAGLQSLVSDLDPVLKGHRTESVADNVRARVNMEYQKIKEAAKVYRESLGDELAALDVFLGVTGNALKRSYGVTDYKATKGQAKE